MNELAEAKKLPPSAKKDSVIIEILYQIIQIPSENVSKWRDSLKFYSRNNNRIAYLLDSIREADNLINGVNKINGSKSLLSIAKELESKKYYAYSSYAYLKIGAIYGYILPDKNQKNKAFPYYKKALELALLSDSELDIVRAYDYLGEVFLELKDYPRAIEYLKIAEKRQLSNDIQYMLPTIYASLAACYLGLNEMELAQKYYQKISPILEDKKYGIAAGYRAYINHIYISKVAEYYFLNNMYQSTINRCKEGLEMIAIFEKAYDYRNDFETYKLSYLELLHKSYFKQNNFKEAYYYLNLFEIKQQKFFENIQKEEINELNLKYQTEQNKLKITALENENLKKDVEKQSTIKYFGIILISLLLAVIGITFYSNFRLKKKNSEISKALLKGQTIERQRVALDLHDNLGSTLSALWLSIDTIDKSKMNTEEKEIHQNLRENLEKAYNDVRLLSHNLLPEEFEKQGLVPTLQGFVRKISKNSKIRFDLQIDEGFGRVDNKIEFELYSICLELVNNIVKHSKATEAKIELSRTERQISLKVSDNGIGTFDNESDGKGMKNVKARVESLNGTWDLVSKENEGTNSQINIPI
ncbi:histidine kinase [Lacihabitans sp. LS3-19]|uniref:ATP-binding protein n=1 Tax=Lacihabitans sp. LS3-19 TaxID=2487335 RepID=UPI0020CF5361|nr:histidine kinase [Lacihabitans sp. LS3-19]